MNEVSPSYYILGVHQAVRPAEPHPGVPEAGLPEDCVQPRALRHPESALQPAHSARFPLPLRLLRHLTGDGANMDVHQGRLQRPLALQLSIMVYVATCLKAPQCWRVLVFVGSMCKHL